MTDNTILDEAADRYADEHAFRVPYNGSNKFYDDNDFKWSKEGFIAGAKWQEQQTNGIDEDDTRLKNILYEFIQYYNSTFKNGNPYQHLASNSDMESIEDFFNEPKTKELLKKP